MGTGLTAPSKPVIYEYEPTDLSFTVGSSTSGYSKTAQLAPHLTE